jgi:hypothetical protein
MFGQRRIGVGRHLGADTGGECQGHDRWPARAGAWGHGAGRALPRTPAANRRGGDIEGLAGLRVRHPRIERGQHSLAQIG